MMTIIDNEGRYTTTDVAHMLKVSPLRVRQLARQYGVGKTYAGRLFLTIGDINRLKARPIRKAGRPLDANCPYTITTLARTMKLSRQRVWVLAKGRNMGKTNGKRIVFSKEEFDAMVDISKKKD